MAQSLDFLSKLSTPFYFCSGGIGDALLLLSTFFDDKEKRNSSIIFWANNQQIAKKLFQEFHKSKIDNGLEHIIVFQGFGTKEDYDKIVNHSQFRGKAHFPDNMDFLEWVHNSEKYTKLFNIPFKTLKEFSYIDTCDVKLTIGISPVGSNIDSWKNKRITKEQFHLLCNKLIEKHANRKLKLVLFGTEEEKQIYGTPNYDRIIDVRGKDFYNVFGNVNKCDIIYAADSFVKTIAGLLEKKTYIFKNEYSINPREIFGIVDYDPADNIFLKDFKFTIASFNDILDTYI